jgi:hypothetical protein
MNGIAKRLSLAATVLGLLVTAAGVGHADIIAYDNAAGASSVAFGNSLGLDFNVISPIAVTSLGAFDSGVIANLNGFDGTSGVTVGIYNRATGTLVGPSVTFTAASPGSQVNGNAFKSIAPFVLPAGFQGSIVAFNDINFNSFGSPNPTSTQNGAGFITFVGGGRFANGFVYPTTIDGGPTNRYDAGTFQFVATPEPASLSMTCIGLLCGAGYFWRRKASSVA